MYFLFIWYIDFDSNVLSQMSAKWMFSPSAMTCMFFFFFFNIKIKV